MSNNSNNSHAPLIPASLSEIACAIFWYIQCTVKVPILIMGRHGGGKTSIAEQLAEYLGYLYLNRRASQDTEGDAGGIPYIEKNRGRGASGGHTVFAPLKWLKQASEQPTIVNLDELDRSTPEVGQAYFQLADSRRIRGTVLHPESVVISCINGGGEHGKNYRGVRPMGPAEFSRWGVFQFRFSLVDYIDWANGINTFKQAFDAMPEMPSGPEYDAYVEKSRGMYLHKVLQEFLTEHPQFANQDGDLMDNTVYPTPRSWTRLSAIITPILYMWEQSRGNLSAKLKNTLQLIVQSQVGHDVSMRLEAFLNDYSFRVSAQDVLSRDKKQMAVVAEWQKDVVRYQPVMSELLSDIFRNEPDPSTESGVKFDHFDEVDMFDESPAGLAAVAAAMDKVEAIKDFFHLLPAELKAAMWKEYMCALPMFWTAHFYGLEDAEKEAKVLEDLGVLIEE
jgi:hypothetical protein